MNKIDVTFAFTSDTPGFWDGFWERRDGLGQGGADPDSESPTLHEYHRVLWSQRLPNGQTMNLRKGTGYYYLTWEDFRFASDTIITDIRYERNKNIIRAKEELSDYRAFITDLVIKGYTIGGTIIFPKHTNSINQCRGTNPLVSDRWDLTMECIRRHYAGEKSPLSKVLESDRKFFDLFVDFKGYADFFFLQDCVSEDYQTVEIWEGKGDFFEEGLPKEYDDYMTFLKREYEFLEKRNKRIAKYCKENSL